MIDPGASTSRPGARRALTATHGAPPRDTDRGAHGRAGLRRRRRRAAPRGCRGSDATWEPAGLRRCSTRHLPRADGAGRGGELRRVPATGSAASRDPVSFPTRSPPSSPRAAGGLRRPDRPRLPDGAARRWPVAPRARSTGQCRRAIGGRRSSSGRATRAPGEIACACRSASQPHRGSDAGDRLPPGSPAARGACRSEPCSGSAGGRRRASHRFVDATAGSKDGRRGRVRTAVASDTPVPVASDAVETRRGRPTSDGRRRSRAEALRRAWAFGRAIPAGWRGVLGSTPDSGGRRPILESRSTASLEGTRPRPSLGAVRQAGVDRWSAIVPDDFFDPVWVPATRPGRRRGARRLPGTRAWRSVVVPDLYSPAPLAPGASRSARRPRWPVRSSRPCAEDAADRHRPQPSRELTGLASDPAPPRPRSDRARCRRSWSSSRNARSCDRAARRPAPASVTARSWPGAARFDSAFAAAYHPWLRIPGRTTSARP